MRFWTYWIYIDLVKFYLFKLPYSSTLTLPLSKISFLNKTSSEFVHINNKLSCISKEVISLCALDKVYIDFSNSKSQILTNPSLLVDMINCF